MAMKLYHILYFLKYMTLSMISAASKILDIVIFWDYIFVIGCFTFSIAVNDTFCFDLPWSSSALTQLGFIRFVSTFAFGIILFIIFIIIWLRIACKEELGPCVGTLVPLICAGPLILLTKVVTAAVRLISIIYFYIAIQDIGDSDIPDQLKVFWGSQLSIPETLISGSILWILAIVEICIMDYAVATKSDLIIRIFKIVFGFISLITSSKDLYQLQSSSHGSESIYPQIWEKMKILLVYDLDEKSENNNKHIETEMTNI